MNAVGAIVGPTAVGKSALAVEVAERIGAEIVSVDSMQIYRSLEAGTAKPSDDLRARVPHHLIDAVDPGDELSVAAFQKLARATIDDIHERGKLPLLVGGSGLYFRSVVDVMTFPPRSRAVRTRLEDVVINGGLQSLYERLQQIDLVAAARIEPSNARRVVRALEAIELTGRRFSDNRSWDEFESIYDLAVVGLTRSRPDLFARIEKRVDQMLAAGLVGEARALAKQGLSTTARQAVGYKQILEASPEDTAAETRARIIRATKRLARRQESWFKSDPRIGWVNAEQTDSVDVVTERLQSSAAVPLES
ncbi:MAG: tRNA (adenosine(37)-N6)-dimethylallyltransferase MiaA [Actinobacteria bacterium]|nr:tRNA (adenosine(37)-N6)-dimethylallyltransferase MiaA [Actinomycetota bacterium]